MHLENQLIETFTGKATLDDTTVQQWTAIADRYPAFNLGHYFKAKKLGGAENEQTAKQRHRAALYFNDIRWLDYLLKAGAVSQPPTGALTEQAPEAATAAATQTQTDVMASEDRSAAGNITPATADLPAGEAVPEDLPHEQQNSRVSAVLSAQLADFKKPVEADARLEVEREPLYKVDYFASQGISLLKSQDGFDKKVRKFTDWLKEIKQQGAGAAAPQLNTTPQEEALAAEKAEQSLKNEPVWTESMAEVLAEQGKAAQAREVYQKLSLLYPEKSSYFASKIDLLQ